MPRIVTCQGANITLDLLLHRAYGRRGGTDEMLASALALNRGLASAGSLVPLGRTVVLPDLATAPAQPVRAAVNLFGDV